MKRASLNINLGNMVKNAGNIKNSINGDIIAVVKNNAYNFGLKESVAAFYKAGIRAFATTSLEEAVYIRTLLQDVKIILLNSCSDFDILRENDISVSLPSLEFLTENFENMRGINYHLEWAGEMRRAGARSIEEVISIMEFSEAENICIEGIWTHFAWADEFDESESYILERERWKKVLNSLLKDYSFRYIHAQNSASYCRDGLLENHTHLRLGIILYGCLPYENADRDLETLLERNGVGNFEILHSLELKAEVVNTVNLNPGESIGYCSSFKAEKPARLATVNIGYGDGLMKSRILGREVLVNGVVYTAVSLMMSHTVFLADESVRIGDTVTFYSEKLPVHYFTFKGVGANSQQISYLNHSTLDIKYTY